MHLARRAVWLVLAGTATAILPPTAAQLPSANDVLRGYRPIQKDVEYDTPEAGEIARCRVDVERGTGTSAIVVFGPSGEVLRRFTDTNGDRHPDMFRYYRMGLEVYRDIDSNHNQKPDQYRWMNWGGTRWGLDSDEDGRIDDWKVLSAHEAAQVAVEALIRKDVQALRTVLITSQDIHKLRIDGPLKEQLMKSVDDPAGKIQKILARTRVIGPRTQWMQFDPPVPGVIPNDDPHSGADVYVYENAMAMVENGDDPELISIGEMVQVGKVWKLTQLPNPLDSSNAQVQLGGILMQPRSADLMVQESDSVSKEMQALLQKLEEIDEAMPGENATAAQLVQYNRRRADAIERIIPMVNTEKQRLEWTRQFVDGLAAAIQTGEYSDGLKRLTRLQEKVQNNKDLLGYIWYRRLLAEYAVRLGSSRTDDERQACQEWWFGQLEEYARRWPKSDDAADAIIQLAISLELMGRIDDARSWYSRLAKNHPRTNGGIRARGALRRLDLTGKRLELTGKTLAGQDISVARYQGKVLLVVFWATWATPYAKDLPAINAVYTKHRQAGFEILSVNLDANAAAVNPFIQKFGGGSWQHIRDAGGTDGQLAKDFGIVSVPTMFLVDRHGIVAGGITAENLETAVETLLQGKPLGGSSRPTESAAGPRSRN